MAFQRQSSFTCVRIKKQNLHIFKRTKPCTCYYFEDEVFLIQLAYVCDTFSKLNQLNIFLQGKETHLLQLYNNITAFKRKLQLWKTDLLINNEQCDSFSLLKSYFNSQSSNLSLQNTDGCDMKTVMCSHLDALISQFKEYFSEDMEKHDWIKNPFFDNANTLSRVYISGS